MNNMEENGTLHLKAREDSHDSGQLVFPELNRLHSFIKDLENELDCEVAEQDMFKSVSLDLDVTDVDIQVEDELRVLHTQENESTEDAVRQYLDTPVTPIHDLYRGFTPHHTPFFDAHPHSNLDIFLMALAEAGYTNVDPGNVKDEAPSGYTTLANEFFDSALENGEKSPIVNPGLNETPSVKSLPASSHSNDRNSHPLSLGMEHFTAESLRRNWDLDDDEEDSGSSAGGISPKSPLFGVGAGSHISKINSNMQFPDLLSSPISPGTNNSAVLSSSSSTAEQKIDVDPRLHGDFNVWSGGPMLSSESIQKEYLGLHPTALTHYIHEGRLLPCSNLSERLSSLSSHRKTSVRTFYDGPYDAHDISLPPSSSISSPNMTVSSIYAHQQGTGGNMRRQSNAQQSSTTPVHIQQQSSIPFFYNRHVMECVIRPDRELKHVILTLCRFFFDRQCVCQQLQANHLVVFPPSTATNSSVRVNNNKSENHGETFDDIVVSKDWDMLDIQICLSRELKQRILLMQFVHKIPVRLVEAMGFASGNTAIVSNSQGGSAFVANALSSSAHVLISAGIIPDSLPLRACPPTRKLAVHFKKLLIGENLTLSALYTAPIPDVCALPRGLDTHFLALLQSYTREQLWTRLREDYRTMDEHVRELEEQTNSFVKLLEPIYKAYGMSIQDMVYKPISSTNMVSSSSSSAKNATSRHEIHQEKQVQRRASQADKTSVSVSSALYTAVVEEDHLVAVRTPFPTSTPLHTNPSTNDDVENASTDPTDGGADDHQESKSSSMMLEPTDTTELTSHTPVAKTGTTMLPPSALKSPNRTRSSAAATSVSSAVADNEATDVQTPNRSVTIRLDTNTFHEAQDIYLPQSPDASTTTTTDLFQTPTRPNAEDSSLQTPLSALTVSPADSPLLTSQSVSRSKQESLAAPPLVEESSTKRRDADYEGDEDSMSTVTLSSSAAVSKKTFTLLSPSSSIADEKKWAMAGPVSPGTARVIMQSDMSPASVKVRLQEQYAHNSKVDGMVFCLIMRDKILQEMQHVCDQEYAERMCNRHNLTLLAVQDLTAHRKSLLMSIICHPHIQKANLMKTFQTTFQGVPVTRWVPAEQIAGTATIVKTPLPTTTSSASTAPAPSVKSFFSSFFSASTANASDTATNAQNVNNDSANSNTGITNGFLAVASVFPLQEEVVLYYFAFITATGQQGTIYFTTRYFCMVSSLMGFMNTKKEVFSLADLTEYVVTTSGEHESQVPNTDGTAGNNNSNGGNKSKTVGNVAANLFSMMKVLRFVFQGGRRELVVRPALVDASKVHLVISEIFTQLNPLAPHLLPLL